MARKLIQDIFVKGKIPDAVRADYGKDAKKQNEKPQIPEPEKEFIEKRQDFKKIFQERKKGFEVTGYPSEPEEKISKKSHIFIWTVCILAIATLLFFVSSIFSTATLTITPKSEPVSLNDLYMITTSTSTAQSLTFIIRY